MIEKFLLWWWRRRVQRLENAYFNDFEKNILEAQKRRNLPQSTVEIRNKFNQAVAALKKLDPNTHWKPKA